MDTKICVQRTSLNHCKSENPEKRINKVRYIYAMEHYTAIQKTLCFEEYQLAKMLRIL